MAWRTPPAAGQGNLGLVGPGRGVAARVPRVELQLEARRRRDHAAERGAREIRRHRERRVPQPLQLRARQRERVHLHLVERLRPQVAAAVRVAGADGPEGAVAVAVVAVEPVPAPRGRLVREAPARVRV